MVCILCSIWLLLILGCMRFAHLQRSTFVSAGHDHIEFLAARGKSRVDGLRKPFTWRVPFQPLTGLDLGRLFARVIRLVNNSAESPFLLPNVLPRTSKVGELKGLRDSPMSAAKFVNLSRDLFAQPPFSLCADEITSVTTYSARRLLPTLADMSMLPTEQALAVGAWTDSALGQQAARRAMPKRYADQSATVGMTVSRWFSAQS